MLRRVLNHFGLGGLAMFGRGGDCIDVVIRRLAGVPRFGTTRAIVVCSHGNVLHERAAGRRVAMLNVATEYGRERFAIF
jgi:hypothetical protein